MIQSIALTFVRSKSFLMDAKFSRRAGGERIRPSVCYVLLPEYKELLKMFESLAACFGLIRRTASPGLELLAVFQTLSLCLHYINRENVYTNPSPPKNKNKKPGLKTPRQDLNSQPLKHKSGSFYPWMKQPSRLGVIGI